MKQVKAWQVDDGGLFACKEGALRYEAGQLIYTQVDGHYLFTTPSDVATWLDMQDKLIMDYFGKTKLEGHLAATYAIEGPCGSFDPELPAHTHFLDNSLQAVREYMDRNWTSFHSTVFDPANVTHQLFIRKNLEAVIKYAEAETRHRRKAPSGSVV